MCESPGDASEDHITVFLAGSHQKDQELRRTVFGKGISAAQTAFYCPVQFHGHHIQLFPVFHRMAVAICQRAYHKECGLSVSLDQSTHQPVVIPEAWKATVEGTVFVLRFFQVFLDLSCAWYFLPIRSLISWNWFIMRSDGVIPSSSKNIFEVASYSRYASL